MGEHMKNLLYIAMILSGLAAGCAWDNSTAPQAQEPTWNLVRFHETAAADDSFRDLSVRTDGELTLIDGRGDGMSERGLLAGEKLETLARLIDALPPQSYAASSPCNSDGFFVSITRGGEVLTYASGSCDAGAPAALTELHQMFDRLALEVLDHKVVTVEFRTLQAGAQSHIRTARRMVIRDRDALVQLLREHQPDQPVAIPRVDFSRQMVVAEFSGDRPTGGYEVGVAGIERTDSGWLRVRLDEVEPGSRCAVSPAVTQPFTIVVVDGHDPDVLFESDVTTTRCD
jgi:hypothetical protein